MVEFQNWLLVNVYAHSGEPKKREELFNGIQRVLEPWKHMINMGGDFNCVYSPPTHRMEGHREEKPESLELIKLQMKARLLDAN